LVASALFEFPPSAAGDFAASDFGLTVSDSGAAMQNLLDHRTARNSRAPAACPALLDHGQAGGTYALVILSRNILYRETPLAPGLHVPSSAAKPAELGQRTSRHAPLSRKPQTIF
jgi:hypothetical protein